MSFGTVAHRELDAEINAEADEQHREGDGYHVQRADHHQAKGRGDRQANEQIDEDGEDEAA